MKNLVYVNIYIQVCPQVDYFTVRAVSRWAAAAVAGPYHCLLDSWPPAVAGWAAEPCQDTGSGPCSTWDRRPLLLLLPSRWSAAASCHRPASSSCRLPAACTRGAGPCRAYRRQRKPLADSQPWKAVATCRRSRPVAVSPAWGCGRGRGRPPARGCKTNNNYKQEIVNRYRVMFSCDEWIRIRMNPRSFVLLEPDPGLKNWKFCF